MDKKQNISPLLIRQGFLIRNNLSLFPSVLRAVNYYQGLTSRPWLKTDHLRKIGVIRLIPLFLSHLLKRDILRDILDSADSFEFFVPGQGHTTLNSGNALYPLDIFRIHTFLPHFIIKDMGKEIIRNRMTKEFIWSYESMQPPSLLFPSMIHGKEGMGDNQTNAPMQYSLPFQKGINFVKGPSLCASSITLGMPGAGGNEDGGIHLHAKKPAMFPAIKSGFEKDIGSFFHTPLYPQFISKEIGATIIKNIESGSIKNRWTAISKDMGAEIVKNKSSPMFVGSKEFIQPPSFLFPPMTHTEGGIEDNQANAPMHYSLPFQGGIDSAKGPIFRASSMTFGMSGAELNEEAGIYLHAKKPAMFPDIKSGFEEDIGNSLHMPLYPQFVSKDIGAAIIKNIESGSIKNRWTVISKDMGAEIVRNKRTPESVGSKEFMQPPSFLFPLMIHAKKAGEEDSDENVMQMPPEGLDGETNFHLYAYDSVKDKNRQSPGSMIPPEIFPINTAANRWKFLIAQLSRSEDTPLGIIPRLTMERYFPHYRLSDVRIHTDIIADRATRALGADAFTLGRDIFFKAGSFRPDSIKGLALLGHELVHVYQFDHGLIASTSSHQAELERDALNAEWSLSGIHYGKDHPADRKITYFNNRVNLSLSPITMELKPTKPSSTHQGSGNVEHFNMSTDKGFSKNVPYLMKADEDRDPAAQTTMTESTPPPQAGEDTTLEDLSRQLYRYIGRQIILDKERRGID